LAQKHADSPESLLLSAAAATFTYRRASAIAPQSDEPSIAPAEPDEAPRLHGATAGYVHTILEERYDAVLDEWLDAAINAGVLARPMSIPKLLEFARRHESVRRKIGRVLGNRGRWLAAQNPIWNFMAAELSPEIWRTGTTAERLLYFRQLRETDPGSARELLSQSWEKESSRELPDLVKALKANLSANDEPLLQALAAHKRKDVNNAAYDLLAGLPDSEYVESLWRDARRVLYYANGMIEVDFVPLNEITYSDTDIIESYHGFGSQGAALINLLQHIPPQRWSKEFNATPAQIITATVNHSDWAAALLIGFMLAAGRFNDAEWARIILTLIQQSEAVDRLIREHRAATHLTDLIRILPPDERETIFGAALAASPSEFGATLVMLVQGMKHRWSIAFSRIALDWLIHFAQSAPNAMRDIRAYHTYFANHLDVSLADEAQQRLSTINMLHPRRELITPILTLRRNMLAEIEKLAQEQTNTEQEEQR
jgi:hypothetical protein